MRAMDQGNAAVIAAGLGIAGTLLGSLGGAIVAARATRKQVRDQEGAEHRNWLRQERRASYAALLDACSKGMDILRRHALSGGGYLAEETVLNVLGPVLEARTLVEIAGPVSMERLADEVVDCFIGAVNTQREMIYPDGATDSEERSLNSAIEQYSAARAEFVTGAHSVFNNAVF